MGGYKDIQTEGEEKAHDPVFRIAVLTILEDVLEPIFLQQTESLAKAFAFRGELKKSAYKKKEKK